MRKTFILILFCLIHAIQLRAQQPNNILRDKIYNIIHDKNATVGVSIKNIETNDTLSINGNIDAPMMSVFKFHIALATLNLVDKNKLKLSDTFFIKKEDLPENTWSPIRDEFPDGNITLTLEQLLRYTVSHSDNNGCDILLRIIGGTKTVQKFINKKGIKDFTIQYNEQEMNSWEKLHVNSTTPLATTKLLEKFYKEKILKKETTRYLYQIMIETSRGLTWMKAGLPANTELAHRTGISDTNNDGLRLAMNNVGIFKLPNGEHIILSIFLKNINENRTDTENILANIAEETYNYYTSQK